MRKELADFKVNKTKFSQKMAEIYKLPHIVVFEEIQSILNNHPELLSFFELRKSPEAESYYVCSEYGEMMLNTYSTVIGAENYVYIISHKGFDGYYKIGISNNFRKRMEVFNTASPLGLNIIALYKVKHRNPAFLEANIHSRFTELRENGEWFKLTPKELAEAIEMTETLTKKTLNQLEIWSEKNTKVRRLGLGYVNK